MLAVPALLASLLVVNARPLSKRYDGVRFQASRDGKCLGISGNAQSGSAVQSIDCAGAPSWNISPGSGSVILSGTNLALDAGEPHNNGALVLGDTQPGKTGQMWYLTDDQRIAITGGDQCLDEGDNGVQTYQCTTGNTNQVWNILTTDPTPSPSPSPTSGGGNPSATGIPTGTVYPDPAGGGGRRIHPKDREDLCVSVIAEDDERDPADGTQVAIAYCLPLDDPNGRLQLWDLGCPGSTGLINLHGGGTCIASGTDDLLPSDGSPIVVRACEDGKEQQTWSFSDDAQLCLANGQCLNVKQESQAGDQQPFYSLRDLQTWRTGAEDPNTNFFLVPTAPGPHSGQC